MIFPSFSSVLGAIDLGYWQLGAIGRAASSADIVFDAETLTFTEHLTVTAGGGFPPVCEPVPDQIGHPELRFVNEPYESAGT